MKTSDEIIEALGHAEMARALGVRENAVSNAKGRGSLPSSWYSVVSDLCREKGIECPRTAFNFKRHHNGTSSEAA